MKKAILLAAALLLAACSCPPPKVPSCNGSPIVGAEEQLWGYRYYSKGYHYRYQYTVDINCKNGKGYQADRGPEFSGGYDDALQGASSHEWRRIK